MSVERTVPRQCKLDCRGLVRVAVVSVERTIPRQSFLTTSVAENQLSRYSPCRGTVRLPTKGLQSVRQLVKYSRGVMVIRI